ncbi:MAG: OmpA family protein [Candidatus Hydrogenedentes bacterium]|nr:OmpA family protein [Candidatus Hydrogenedentota bacterium]
MKKNPLLFSMVLALVGTLAPVWAQDTAQPAATPETEAAPAAEAAPAPAAPADVWWGNRSISYGNYIKFDRITIDMMAPAPTPAGPVVLDTLHFDKNKAVLSPGARAIVDDAVRLLRANADATVVIEIQGGAAPSGLGQRRADAVKSYVVENGIAAERLSITSVAEPRVTAGNVVIIPVSAD